MQFRTLLRHHHPCAMSVRLFLFFSGALSLHAALLTFSFRSVSFAVASALRTISLAVCLPGWRLVYLWYFVYSGSFRFLLSFGLWCSGGLCFAFLVRFFRA